MVATLCSRDTLPRNLVMRHCVMVGTHAASASSWQGRSDGGAAAALAPAEVLAAAKAFQEDGGGAGGGTADRAVFQVAWDGRQGLAAASADGLVVFSLHGLRQRLADAGDGQVMAVEDAEMPKPC
jgi:hypothetical protein